MSGVQYRDRETGETRTETVFAERGMRFLYGNPFGRVLTGLLLKHRWFSCVGGWLQRRRKGKSVAAFADRLKVCAEEAEHPLGEYRTLDAFFTRRLKPGARPVDPDADSLVCPSDGRVLVYPLVVEEIVVKGNRLSLKDLVRDPDLALRYRGGGAVVVRLAPGDYHRFHFPDSGTASAALKVRGGLHSVHPCAVAAGAPIFRNKRMLTRISSRGFGELLMVEVGAMLVGTIVQTYTPGAIERGQEKGTFRFGGSTIVLLVQPGRAIFDDDLVASSGEGTETFVKMGRRIARRE
ncbi:MAG: phosphatidylserine decarboxylase [Planctomycetota bacterium]